MASDITRRSFVTTAAAGMTAAAVAAAAGVRQARAVSASSVPAWDYETDVLVCGYGTGGSAAAVAAADEGAQVLIIEKMDWTGGELRRCGGGILAADTQVQHYLGIEDDPEEFAEFWIAACCGFADEDLVREYCLNSASVIDWVIDDLGGEPLEEWEICGENNGLELSYGPGLNGGNSLLMQDLGFTPVPRTHWFKENPDDEYIDDPSKYFMPGNSGGTGLYKVFKDAIDARGVESLTETALTRLVTADGSNEVIGAVADQGGKEVYIKARKAVIVATGNFGSNHEMRLNYTMADYEPNAFGVNGLDIPGENDGSGINALLALGAQLRHPALVNNPLEHAVSIPDSLMCAGVQTDLQARCLDVFGDPIPRLYVASTAAGGMTAGSYPGCGASVGCRLYFGRVAGRQAASLEPLE